MERSANPDLQASQHGFGFRDRVEKDLGRPVLQCKESEPRCNDDTRI